MSRKKNCISDFWIFAKGKLDDSSQPLYSQAQLPQGRCLVNVNSNEEKKTYWNCAKLVTIVSCSNPVVVTLSVVYFDFGEDEEKKRINKKGGLYTRTVRKKIVALWMDSTHTHIHT